MWSRTVAPLGGIPAADRPINLPLYRRGTRRPIRHVLERVARGLPRAPVTSGCLLNRDLNVDNRTRPRQPAPPLLERGRKRPRRAAVRDAGSAVGEVDGALLRALAADGRVGGGPVVGGRPLRARVGGRRGVQALLQLGGRPVRVLGRTDVGPVVGELTVEPAGERLALGLLEGGRAVVDARVGPLAGDGLELGVLHPVLLGDAVLQVGDAVVLEGDVACGLALAWLSHRVASVLRGDRAVSAGDGEPAVATGVCLRPYPADTYPGDTGACAGVCPVARRAPAWPRD